MGLFDFLFGSEQEFKKLPTMSRGQSNILNQLLMNLKGLGGSQGGYQNALQLLQGYLNPESDVYKNFEAPYMRQFNEQTVPQLAERFAGLGGGMGGGLSSSGFAQALGAAGAGLQENLASLKSGMQRQAAGDIFCQYNQMLNQGLGRDTFAYGDKPASVGFLPQLAYKFAEGAGRSLGGG